MRLARLAASFASTPFALDPAVLEQFAQILQREQLGTLVDAEARSSFAARTDPGRRNAGQAAGARENVAVIPVYGVISQRANMLMDVCGGTSTEMLEASIRAAAADRSVRSIVLDIDSPGGSVFGVLEVADAIYQARAEKPIAAVANATAASAAYWIASAAHEIFVTPSGEVGSIGVYGQHVDTSRADEAAGVTRTVVSAGKYKTEGMGPLSNDARDHMQSRIDDYYTQFVKAVARYRNVPVDTVRRGYGEGRTLNAQPALAAGMVDGVSTLNQVIAKYARRTIETANRGKSVAMSAGVALRSAGLPDDTLARVRLSIAAHGVKPQGGLKTAEEAQAYIDYFAKNPTDR